jgi:hypothetical protein
LKANSLNLKNGILIAILVACFIVSTAKAEVEDRKVDYSGGVIVDSDLDGLTDSAEIQIYHTNPNSSDTDGDGILDGTEVIQGTNPLDVTDPGTTIGENITSSLSSETPWAWYIVRAAGLIGFVFLWLTIFLGLAIRNPLLKKIIEPMYSFDFHCFTAAMAVFWSLVHGTGLLFDSMLGFGVKDIFIPFFSQTTIIDAKPLALGIVAFWMLVVMTVTSYLRQHMSHWLWRALHFLNPLAFIFVVIHGYKIGTDMKNFYIGGAYLASSALLGFIYFSSLIFVIINKFRRNNEYSN